MNKIAIIHFNPLELYPPVQNFIRAIEKDDHKTLFYVFTTKGVFNTLNAFKSNRPDVRIIRIGRSGLDSNRIIRSYYYFLFYAGTLLYLLINKPRAILYYETISSYPAYLYKRYFNKNVSIFIHYHEYTSPREYENGMKITKLFHQNEKYLYPLAKWISHTNIARMELFMKDLKPVKIANPGIFPNYPPLSWKTEARVKTREPLKIVYVGSLSMDTMYTREFSQWLIEQNGEAILDIYTFNCTMDAKTFLMGLNSDFINLKEGNNYEELPVILQQYDIGIILYTGHIPNYIYNAPNKLFEYLACGLDVWYPKQMIGCKDFDSPGFWPKVIPLDFKNLGQYELKLLCERKEGFQRSIQYSSEMEAAPLIKKLLTL